MALTEAQKSKVTNWVKDAHAVFAVLPPDIQQNIKPNRDKLLPFFLERLDIDTISGNLGEKSKADTAELSRLLYEYEHYFDKGYRSSENIDTLPDKLRVAFSKLARADL